MTFYQRLNELKAEKGVSQKEIQNALGIGKNSFGYWRNGVTPNRSTQLLLAEYFDVSVEYLMGETDIKEKPATDEGDELSQEFKSLYCHLTQEQREIVLAAMREFVKEK